MRMPKCRRPKERSWEFANVRSFGIKSGGQNYKMWFGTFIALICVLSVEWYRQWLRIKARGDTCPACEVARDHYRERLKKTQKLVDLDPDTLGGGPKQVAGGAL